MHYTIKTTATTTATATCSTTSAIDSSYHTISIGPWRKSLLHFWELGYVLDIRFTHDKWSGNNKNWFATNRSDWRNSSKKTVIHLEADKGPR